MVTRSVVVGLVATALVALVVVRIVAAAGWDPTVMTAFGEKSDATLAYAQDRLGDVSTRSGQGHDGKFFFISANDPFLLDPENNAAVLDRPRYRSQRMLYPAVASGFGYLSPEAIVWAMITVNVVSIGVGSAAVALFATRRGRSPWWGLAFGLNLGVFEEVMIGGGGALAAGLLMVGILLVEDGRYVTAGLTLSAACLAREALLLSVAGIGLWMWSKRSFVSGVTVVAPSVVFLSVWAIYVRIRLDSIPSGDEVQELGWPFIGLARAAVDWGPVTRLIAPIVAILLVRLIWLVATSPTLIGFASVPFALIAPFFTYQVWLGYFDIARAVSIAITGFILVSFVERTNSTTDSPSTIRPA